MIARTNHANQGTVPVGLRFLCAGMMALCISLCFTWFYQTAAIGQEKQNAQPKAAPAGETYRLRIENNLYGRVEISMDGGQKFILLGRVTHPANKTLLDRTAAQPGSVLRGSSEGIAFTTTSNAVLKIRPAQSGGPQPSRGANRDSEIEINVTSQRGLFGKLMTPVGSQVLYQPDGHSPGEFPEGYSLSVGDVFVFIAALPLPETVPASPGVSISEKTTQFIHSVRAQFESIAADYAEHATERATKEKRKVASGTLTLRPNLPPDEPDPITAVTYSIDEQVVCARTTAPYLFGWETTSVSDGEHVIEVRALSPSGAIITKSRYLVVVKNGKQ